MPSRKCTIFCCEEVEEIPYYTNETWKNGDFANVAGTIYIRTHGNKGLLTKFPNRLQVHDGDTKKEYRFKSRNSSTDSSCPDAAQFKGRLKKKRVRKNEKDPSRRRSSSITAGRGRSLSDHDRPATNVVAASAVGAAVKPRSTSFSSSNRCAKKKRTRSRGSSASSKCSIKRDERVRSPKTSSQATSSSTTTSLAHHPDPSKSASRSRSNLIPLAIPSDPALRRTTSSPSSKGEGRKREPISKTRAGKKEGRWCCSKSKVDQSPRSRSSSSMDWQSSLDRKGEPGKVDITRTSSSTPSISSTKQKVKKTDGSRSPSTRKPKPQSLSTSCSASERPKLVKRSHSARSSVSPSCSSSESDMAPKSTPMSRRSPFSSCTARLCNKSSHISSASCSVDLTNELRGDQSPKDVNMPRKESSVSTVSSSISTKPTKPSTSITTSSSSSSSSSSSRSRRSSSPGVKVRNVSSASLSRSTSRPCYPTCSPSSRPSSREGGVEYQAIRDLMPVSDRSGGMEKSEEEKMNKTLRNQLRYLNEYPSDLVDYEIGGCEISGKVLNELSMATDGTRGGSFLLRGGNYYGFAMRMVRKGDKITANLQWSRRAQAKMEGKTFLILLNNDRAAIPDRFVIVDGKLLKISTNMYFPPATYKDWKSVSFTATITRITDESFAHMRAEDRPFYGSHDQSVRERKGSQGSSSDSSASHGTRERESLSTSDLAVKSKSRESSRSPSPSSSSSSSSS